MSIKIKQFKNVDSLILSIKQGESFELIIIEAVSQEAIYKVKEYLNHSKLIILSNDYRYMQDAFRVNAFQYFAKPFNTAEFLSEVQRALTFHDDRNLYEIKYKSSIHVVNINELMYLETCDRHLIATTLSKKIEFIGKLCDEEKKLSQYGFIRCHKCYLLNMKYIVRVNDNCFILGNNTKIPISTRIKKDILQKYDVFIAGKLIV